MDTTSPPTDKTPRSIDAHIQDYVQDCWDQEHETDPARAADLIIERLRKDGDTPEAVICDYFNIRFFESDALLQAIITEEYARSLSAEDKLVFGAGLKPETAQAIVALMDCAATADEAAYDLQEALAEEDFSALVTQVQQMSPTKALDTEVAAALMLNQLPVLNEVLGIPKASRKEFGSDEEEAEIGRFPCAHNAAGYVLAALAECYRERLEKSGSM
jgi:hypothetical protein